MPYFCGMLHTLSAALCVWYSRPSLPPTSPGLGSEWHVVRSSGMPFLVSPGCSEGAVGGIYTQYSLSALSHSSLWPPFKVHADRVHRPRYRGWGDVPGLRAPVVHGDFECHGKGGAGARSKLVLSPLVGSVLLNTQFSLARPSDFDRFLVSQSQLSVPAGTEAFVSGAFLGGVLASLEEWWL